MKRTSPIQRRTPLRAKHWGIRQDLAETRRRRARDRGAQDAPEYLAAVRTLPCRLAGVDGERCAGPVDPHHAGRGLADPDPEMRKTSDRTAVPLCRAHHRDVECLERHCKRWDANIRRAVCDVWILETRIQVEEMKR